MKINSLSEIFGETNCCLPFQGDIYIAVSSRLFIRFPMKCWFVMPFYVVHPLSEVLEGNSDIMVFWSFEPGQRISYNIACAPNEHSGYCVSAKSDQSLRRAFFIQVDKWTQELIH